MKPDAPHAAGCVNKHSAGVIAYLQSTWDSAVIDTAERSSHTGCTRYLRLFFVKPISVGLGCGVLTSPSISETAGASEVEFLLIVFLLSQAAFWGVKIQMKKNVFSNKSHRGRARRLTACIFMSNAFFTRDGVKVTKTSTFLFNQIQK